MILIAFKGFFDILADMYTDHFTYNQRKKRSKTLAALLAIFLGGVGAHKFYLGYVGWGILYALFSWTTFPIFVGVLEGIVYLCISNDSFDNMVSRN